MGQHHCFCFTLGPCPAASGAPGSLDYQTVFANTTGVVIDPTVAFVIDAGQLNVNLQSSSSASESAGLNAVISESINGGTPIDLFDYASSMTATDLTADPSFSESGAVFNPSGPTYSAGEADYTNRRSR